MLSQFHPCYRRSFPELDAERYLRRCEEELRELEAEGARTGERYKRAKAAVAEARAELETFTGRRVSAVQAPPKPADRRSAQRSRASQGKPTKGKGPPTGRLLDAEVACSGGGIPEQQERRRDRRRS